MVDFFNKALQFSRTLYQPLRMGTIVVQLDGRANEVLPSWATVLITEHRPFEARQHTFNLRSRNGLAQRLPAGEYSITVAAQGYAPYRAYAEIKEGQVSTIVVRLERARQQAISFAQKLKQYGVKRDSSSLPNLSVEAGTRVTLDPKSPKFGLDIHYIEMRTIDQVKSFLGHPDAYWATEHPRFGSLAPTRPPAERLDELTPALRAAMQEYVYGNSKSVAAWKTTLNNWMDDNPIVVGLWVYDVVDVAANAVLEIGSGGLVCNTLRVDPTGTVEVSSDGPIRIEMDTYEEYVPSGVGGSNGGNGGGTGGEGGHGHGQHQM